MIDNDMNEKLLKTTFYFEKQIAIHIETSNDKFYNGLIINISKEMIILNDRVLGEIPIPFSEIKVLERFMSKEVKE